MLVRAVRAAAVAVLVSWGVLAALCVVGWLSTSASTTPLTSALAVGSLLWSMANLGPVSDGTTTISLVPLGLVVWPLLVVASTARRLGRALGEDDSPRLDGLGGMRRSSAAALGAFVAGYVVLGVVVCALGRLLPVAPVWWQALLGSLAVGVAGTVVGLRRSLPELVPAWRDQILAAAPPSVRRGARVGIAGAGLLLLSGLLPVLGAVGVHLGQVRAVHDGLHPGVVGGILLVVGQLLLVPNVAAWGLAWLAGPGFAVGSGSTFTWAQSRSVLLPNIPLFGALPDSATHSGWWALVAVLPVAVGAWVGSRALGTVSRLSRVATKVQSVLVAVITSALLGLLALVLSGGALGTRALAEVGPRAVPAAAAVLGELALGAVLALGWSLWRFNRR